MFWKTGRAAVYRIEIDKQGDGKLTCKTLGAQVHRFAGPGKEKAMREVTRGSSRGRSREAHASGEGVGAIWFKSLHAFIHH